MRIKHKHDDLDSEILNAAKAKDFDLVKQKVDLQKKLAEILKKQEDEQKIFEEEQRSNIFDRDELYQKAKEAGNLELLEKFHNHSLTRKEYLKACKKYEIKTGIDYYYNNLDRFDWIGEFNKNGIAKAEIKNKYGFINQEGEEICDIKYDEVNMLENGFAQVGIGHKCGFINPQGKEICEIKYDAIGEFKNGFAKVTIGDTSGFIDQHGNFFKNKPGSQK